MTIESIIATAVADELDPQFKVLSSSISDVINQINSLTYVVSNQSLIIQSISDLQANLLTIIALLGETNPVQPEVVEEVEEPAPDIFVSTINNFSGGNWVHGILKVNNGYIVSIPNTVESLARFTKGSVIQFVDGQVREIYWPQVNGTSISIHVKGEELLDGKVVGFPNKIGSFANRADVPTIEEEATTTSIKPIRNIDFDLKLMGINIAGAEFAPGTPHYHWPTREDFQLYKNEKMNMVRIPFKWERLQPELFGELNPAEVVKLMTTMDLAAEHGFKVLLDLHNYLRYKVGTVNEVVGSDVVPGDAFIDVWKRIATLTKGHPATWAHGLMNEPYVKQPQWPGLAQAAYDAITAIDNAVYVVVSGDHWASASRWDSVNPDFPLVGNRIIYEAHTYLDHNSSGSYTDRNADIPLMVGHDRLMNVVAWCEKHDVMLLIGELSIPHDMPQAVPALRKQFELLVSKNIPIFYWAGGRRWTESSANAMQFQLTLREPISLLREFTDYSTRVIGPLPQ